MKNDVRDLRHLTDFPSSDKQPAVPRNAPSGWTVEPPKRATYPGAPGAELPPHAAYRGSNAWWFGRRK